VADDKDSLRDFCSEFQGLYFENETEVYFS